AEAVEVEIDQRDLRAHAKGDLCRVGADDTAADDADVAGRNTGDTAEKDSPTSVLLLEVGCADLDAHAASDLAHGSQQWESTCAVANGFVGNACDFGGEKSIGECSERGEMEIGKEDETFT